MYLYMYMHMNMYMCTYKHMHMYLNIYIYISIFMYMYIRNLWLENPGRNNSLRFSRAARSRWQKPIDGMEFEACGWVDKVQTNRRGETKRGEVEIIFGHCLEGHPS